MVTFSTSQGEIDSLFDERYNDEFDNFLGICFGSKRCKERRKERQILRNERKEAKNEVKRAKAYGIGQGTFKSTGSGIMDSITGIVGGLFGGGGGQEQPQNNAEMPYKVIEQTPAKKNNTMIYIIIAVVVVASFGFFMYSKSKK